MEITDSGKLFDPEVLQGKKITEIIFNIMYRECKSVKNQFPQEEYHKLAIVIFTMVKFANPVLSDISSYIYKIETQHIGIPGNRERCYRLAQSILVLQPFISDHIAWEEDRRLLRRDFGYPV